MPKTQPELRRAFERQDRSFIAQRGALAIKIGIVLPLLFWGLDWVLVPHVAWRFLAYRLVAATLLAGGLLLYRSVGAQMGYWLALIPAVVLAVMLNIMVIHMGGHRSAYYAGLNLLILGLGLLVPARPRDVAVMCAIVATSYPVAILAFDRIEDVAVFASNCAFIASTVALTMIATFYNHERRFNEYRSREQLAEAHRRLVETDRLKSEFFANVSHEIRTPLTLNVVPIATLLSGDAGPLAPRQRELVEALDRNAVRLRALVTDLLDFSKLEAGKLSIEAEPLDLVPFLDQVADAFAPVVRAKGLELRRALPPGPVVVNADPRKLEKILANLLGNAFKFTDRGEICIALTTDDGLASIEVADTGCGIAPDAVPKLFERFFQVDGTAARRHDGTGIGLSLARELARLHGGEVTCRSEEGKGSAFAVTIPLAGADEAGSSPAALARAAPGADARSPLRETVSIIEAGRAADGVARAMPQTGGADGAAGRPKCLLAEDSADLGAYLVRLLEPRYRVRWVRTGDQALAAAREWRPDVVLSDVMMPGRDGLALTRELRTDAELKTVPVILISARAHKDHVIGGLEGGADDYVVKPFEPDILLSKIGALLRIRRLERELVAAERLTAIGEVVLALKHEVNNSLTGIVGFADVLLAHQGPVLSEDGRRALERMKDLAFRISQVIERAEHLDAARTVEYLGDRKMIDLGMASPAAEAPLTLKPAPSTPGSAPKAPSKR